MKEVQILDTSVLVRLVTGDVPSLAKKAAQLLTCRDVLFSVPELVVTELAYVLKTQYNYSREDISISILALFEHLCILGERNNIVNVLKFYESHPKLSYIDCCLAVQTQQNGVSVLWTCDHKLALQCKNARELV